MGVDPLAPSPILLGQQFLHLILRNAAAGDPATPCDRVAGAGGSRIATLGSVRSLEHFLDPEVSATTPAQDADRALAVALNLEVDGVSRYHSRMTPSHPGNAEPQLGARMFGPRTGVHAHTLLEV
jgi:hypothetical protein